MSGRFQLIQRVCSKCQCPHQLAVQLRPCGRLDMNSSPDTLFCYGCGIGLVGPALRERWRQRQAALWRAAAGFHVPLPDALRG